ncbi:capsular biosynthesis protein [Vibrio sp. IRLE0018]|uniref:lipopolysaccharide biosynthesis protein n=1 Tax=Vibrio TaxID=662 RepID=UPI001594AE8A|nr:MULTISPECIES: capsular biosynthesis protein [Vibrio]MCF8778284.1 capsular biosynthesis protein [Vibrio floridensis]NVC62478.1 capsular biosynthesis protein [Vibrio sp. 05-20-BW147]
MSLIKSITTVASSSILSQVIGAFSIWLISYRFGMAEVGVYALTYSVVLIGAQVCTFATQLLLPKQSDEQLPQNIVFCFIQTAMLALPYASLVVVLFEQSFLLVYGLTLAHAWVLISENLLMRDQKMTQLAMQRLTISLLVASCVYFSTQPQQIYWAWVVGLSALLLLWLVYSLSFKHFKWCHFSLSGNVQFFMANRQHISRIGSAEVLAMVNGNLPTVLITFWFSSLTAGYFAVVSRFCLSPVVIVGNAVRHSIFSKWSVDFRQHRFNFAEFLKVRKLLLLLGCFATAGVFLLYPLVMAFATEQGWVSHEWLDSVPTSQYMLPYLFTALAICPLTVVELVFGSPKYFLRIQFEQLLVVMFAFVVMPYFYPSYEASIIAFALLSALRYAFIYRKVNARAHSMADGELASTGVRDA